MIFPFSQAGLAFVCSQISKACAMPRLEKDKFKNISRGGQHQNGNLGLHHQRGRDFSAGDEGFFQQEDDCSVEEVFSREW